MVNKPFVCSRGENWSRMENCGEIAVEGPNQMILDAQHKSRRDPSHGSIDDNNKSHKRIWRKMHPILPAASQSSKTRQAGQKFLFGKKNLLPKFPSCRRISACGLRNQ